jgi:hypothetical protein
LDCGGPPQLFVRARRGIPAPSGWVRAGRGAPPDTATHLGTPWRGADSRYACLSIGITAILASLIQA